MRKKWTSLTRSLIISGLLIGFTMSASAAPATTAKETPPACPMMTAEHRTHMMHEMMNSPEMKTMMMTMMKEMMTSPEMKPLMMDMMKEMMSKPEMKEMMRAMMHEAPPQQVSVMQEDHSQHQVQEDHSQHQ